MESQCEKVINGILLNTDSFTHLEEFVKLCESHNNGEIADDIVLQYLKKSGGCQEITNLLKELYKSNAKEAEVLLNSVTHILMRIASDLKLYESVAVSISNDALNYATKTVFNFFRIKPKPSRMKTALKLLTSVAIQSPRMAQNVFAKLSVNMDSFPHLLTRSNLVDEEDVRACVIHLIVALLTVGNNMLVRQVVELKGFLNPVFPGLQHDRAPTICIVLRTLKSEVLENTSVSKTNKINLFNDFTMKSVLDLYCWRGPKRTKKGLKRKLGEDEQMQVIEASEEDIAVVRKTAHDFMRALCCSHKSGIIFRDPSYGTSGKNLNHVITNILSSFPSPYSNNYMSELVVATLKACPDVLKFYLPTLKNSLVPRCTNAWVNAIKLLKEIVSAQDPCRCFATEEKKPLPKLLTVVKTVCIPEIVTSSQIIQALEGSDQCVCYHLLDYFSCTLKLVKKTVDFCKSGQITLYSVIELTSFQQSFINNFTATFPVADHIWKYWLRVIKEGFSTSDENAVDLATELPAPASVLSKILEVLMLLREVSPVSVKDVDMNLPDMLSGVERHNNSVSPDELCSIQIQVIELIASQGKVENIFLEKIGEDEGRTSLSIILDLYLSAGNPNVLKSVSDLIHQLLQRTKIFEYGEWEIDLWLRGLKEVKKRYQIHAVKFLITVLVALCGELNKYVDEILSCTVECNSKSNVSRSAVQMLEEFLSNESTMEGEEMCQDLLNMLHKQHCFSAMVPAAMSSIQSLSGSEKKACRQYIEFVLRHIMHHQHSPEIFFTLIQKYSGVFHSNLFNYWKLLYCLKTKEKMDDLEFLEENEEEEKSLSEKLQSNFILKFVHKNLDDNEEDELKLLAGISDLSTEEALYITWQTLMYIEMCTATVTENSTIPLQVSSYLNLLKELTMKAQNDSVEAERYSAGNSPDQIKKCFVLPSVITSVISSSSLLDFFLKTDINQDSGNFPALKKCTNAISKFVLEIIICAQSHQNVTDVQHYLLPFKEKMMRYFASYVIPMVPSGKKLIIKSSLVIDIFQSFTSFLNTKDTMVLLEQCLGLEVKALLKLDPELSIISALLKIHIEEKEVNVLPDEVIKSVCAIYASALDEKQRKCIGNLLLIVLQRHSSYACAVSKKICLSLLKRQEPEDLKVLCILISNNHDHFEVIQDTVMSSAENWDNWNPVFILSLIAKYFCMNSMNSSPSFNSFQQCISHPFWATLSSLLKHEACPEFSDDVACDIGKAVSVLVINKHLELKKIKSVMKAMEKSTGHLSPAKINIVLQILKNVTSNPVASELPSCSFAIKALMNWLVEIVSVMKNFEEPEQIKLLNDCVLVLKNMDASSVECALSDNELWTKYLMKIIKVALKSELIGPRLLEVIKSFCQKVHESNNSTLISASHIYELITGHSNFFQVLLDENKYYHQLKESVVDVLILLVQMDNTVCKSGHISLFLGAYGATLSHTDQKLLYLILLYEKNGISMHNFSPFLWSKAAIAHYSVQKDTRLFLWKQPKMEEVVGNFVPENVILTSLNFPLDLNLEPTYPPANFISTDASCECDLYSIYDPRFVLPLMAVLLSPGSFVHCITFLESKVLGVIFTSLSSNDPNVRAMGYYCLSEFYEHLQLSTFSEKLVWMALLDSIKNAITSPNRRLPSMITVFLAKAVDVLIKPDNPLYVPLYKFLMVKPILDLGHVPEFYTLFGSTAIDYRIQRSWILTLLTDGMRSSLDFHLCSKRYIFSILLPYFDSPISIPQEKVKILKIISAAVSIYSSARTLCQGGLLPWLHNAIVQSDEDDYTIFKYFVYIIKNLWCQGSKRTEEKTMYSSFACELLLVQLSILKHSKAMDSTTRQCYMETLYSTLMHVRATPANENQYEAIDLPSTSLLKIIDQHEKWKIVDEKLKHDSDDQ